MGQDVPTIHLVRHGEHDLPPGLLAGRTPGIALSGRGIDQARRTAERLAHAGGIAAVYSSPLERTTRTAGIIADRLGLAAGISEALIEIDFGDWTGRPFAELDAREDWRRWNHFRSGTRPPGGETMAEVQARTLRFIEKLVHGGLQGSAVLVSHCDVIRAVLAHCLGMPLDLLLRLEVATASVSTIEIGPWGPRILRINEEP
ncbi:histidine phosphatase family protein [Skermanella mucosa]|uniref:histidine phosphatase family protein n=1 Tax=Skermanella mucosa TaxID=1789672 RepID=UPI00192C2A92|nr:histidine phosphatase family protein [Skermanella mucosa]UEM18865.1 histidine phosphatase family protein [Skermanella mucosa]